MVRGRSGFDRPNPGEGVVGGEGKEAWELHQVKAHLWVALEVEGRVGEGGSAEEGGRWWRDLDGEVALTGSGRGGGVGELREVEAELM